MTKEGPLALPDRMLQGAGAFGVRHRAGIEWAAKLRSRSGERVKCLQHTPPSVQIGNQSKIQVSRNRVLGLLLGRGAHVANSL